MHSSGRNPSRWIDQVRHMTLQLVDRDEFAVFLFGGRARQADKMHGDIDVGIWGMGPVPQELLIKLYDVIDESDVPLKVDFVDFSIADETFKKIALKNIVPWCNPPKNDLLK